MLDSENQNFFHGEVVDEKPLKKQNETALSIAKVFLYMFMFILVTAVTAFGVGAGLFYGFVVPQNPQLDVIYLGLVISSAVLLIIDSIVINFIFLRGKHNVLVPALIYSVLVGILFSGLTIFIDWSLLGMAFGITALIFLLMSLIAFTTKSNLSPLLIVAFGILMGVGLLALTSWIFAFINGTVFNGLWFAIEVGIFAFIMIVALVDLWRLKKIAEAGQMSENLALYCAFTMYTDFISVFIRVLYFLLLIYGKNK